MYDEFFLCGDTQSIAILPMASQFNWSEQEQGEVQAAFFVGYLMTQLVGGVLSDRVGGKHVLGLGVLWWSLATCFTPSAAYNRFSLLLFVRFLMGIGEGVSMPAMNTLLACHVPPSERSRATSIVYSGFFLGSALGLGVSPPIISRTGWESVFITFGIAGVLWYFFWLPNASNSPGEDNSITRAELQRISMEQAEACSSALSDEQQKQQQQQQESSSSALAGAPKRNIPWRSFFSSQPVWSIIIAHFCNSWSSFIVLSWLPRYLSDRFSLTLGETGLLALLPWLTMSVAANTAGFAADSLLATGMSLTRVRKLMQTIGFMGPALCLSCLPNVSAARDAVVTVTLSQACNAASHSGFYAQHADIAPQYSGILLALSNSAGIVAGTVGVWFVGYWLEINGTESWDDVWSIAAILYSVGAAIFLRWSTSERQF